MANAPFAMRQLTATTRRFGSISVGLSVRLERLLLPYRYQTSTMRQVTWSAIEQTSITLFETARAAISRLRNIGLE
jgi:hypothetical protein